MAAVSLFWDTNMAAVTSCENTVYIPVHEPVTGLICYIRATGTLTLYH